MMFAHTCSFVGHNGVLIFNTVSWTPSARRSCQWFFGFIRASVRRKPTFLVMLQAWLEGYLADGASVGELAQRPSTLESQAGTGTQAKLLSLQRRLFMQNVVDRKAAAQALMAWAQKGFDPAG